MVKTMAKATMVLKGNKPIKLTLTKGEKDDMEKLAKLGKEAVSCHIRMEKISTQMKAILNRLSKKLDKRIVSKPGRKPKA
jgi:hypothetical protein